jgi:hypothetical protein
VCHRFTAGLPAKSSDGRLRLTDEFSAVPAESCRSRVGWPRQHDIRPRQPRILQRGKSVPVSLAEGQGTRAANRLAKRRAGGRDAIFPGEPDAEQLSAGGRLFLSVRAEGAGVDFIGFELDVPFGQGRARLPWVTNVNKLADGKPLGINWTSSNLNRPWFGGNSCIPNSETCNGNAWRKVIVDGLNQASVGAC